MFLCTLIKPNGIEQDEGKDFTFKEGRAVVAIRENGDYEIIFFFNPNIKSIDASHLKEMLLRASLRTGICDANLNNIKFGEFSIRFNPVISHADDRNFVKNLFMEYLEEQLN